MSSGTHMLSSKVRDTVFTKTARGRAEVTERSAGLNGKQRSVLIMLDGRKSMRDIATLLPEDEIARIVEILLERELIAPWAEAVVSSAAPRMPAIAGRARPDSENHKDAAKLLRTKTLMTDSAISYLGLMASDVVRRVQDASDEIELISVIGHWHMAMRESKYGREFAAIHLEEIKTSLRGEAVVPIETAPADCQKTFLANAPPMQPASVTSLEIATSVPHLYKPGARVLPPISPEPSSVKSGNRKPAA